MILTPFRNKIIFISLVILAFVGSAPMPVVADTKVVVIPLGGDNAPPDPLTPLATESPQPGDYFIGNQSVIDKATGLEWQKRDDNFLRTWNAAWSYCRDLSLGGDGWRMPDLKELHSIVDISSKDPAVNDSAFPGTESTAYWSATTNAGNSSKAWWIFFQTGESGNDLKITTYAVRCVR